MNDFLLILFYSYLSGSIPFGFLITKFFYGKDIRKMGSSNIGATNVLRTGRKLLAASTLMLDIAKGFLPVYFTSIFFPEYINISGLICFLGHIFPIWLKFKGGKGVATYLGILMVLSIPLSILFIFTWVVVALIFKYSSVSSMFSCLTVLVVTVFRENTVKIFNETFSYNNDIKFLLFIFFIMIIFTHRKNISNLKNKTETKIKI